MLQAFFPTLIVFSLLQISNAKNGRIPGQSVFEMTVMKNHTKKRRKLFFGKWRSR
jgi:hypothetical protein